MLPYTKLSPTVRWWLYFVMTVAAAGFGVWQATEGDWGEAVGAAFAAAIAELARANVPKKTDAAP